MEWVNGQEMATFEWEYSSSIGTCHCELCQSTTGHSAIKNGDRQLYGHFVRFNSGDWGKNKKSQNHSQIEWQIRHANDNTSNKKYAKITRTQYN